MAEKFKLQAVLKYRKTLEEQAQQRLAELLSVETQIRQQYGAAQLDYERLAQRLQEKQQVGLSVLEIQLYEDQIFHHRQQREQLEQQLKDVTVLLNERRQELLVAARETKIIEKLKQKQLAEYLRKLDRKERIMLDEISLRQKGGCK
ncbi:MAG: flagellar export protein FliJ [Geopsychrobacter sp.]|nr:flagellar export protein FliJ [Geopsychrobacter sp.]